MLKIGMYGTYGSYYTTIHTMALVPMQKKTFPLLYEIKKEHPMNLDP